MTHSIATVAFWEQASALAKGSADVLWIDTMSSNEEVAAAVEAAKTTGLPICSTMTFDAAKRAMMGVTPADYNSFAAAQGADFIGANCGIGPAELLHSLKGILKQASDIPIVAKGNCGIPAYVDGTIHYLGTPELIAEYALLARHVGAKIIGVCCGTTQAHVAAMDVALNNTAKRPFDPAAMTAAISTVWNRVDKSAGGNAPRGGRRGRGRRR